MNTPDTDIDPRLEKLPREGKFEYLRWCETFQRLTMGYMRNAEELNAIRHLDPAHAALYDRKIEALLGKASETMEEWQGHRARILSKWLPEV